MYHASNKDNVKGQNAQKAQNSRNFQEIDSYDIHKKFFFGKEIEVLFNKSIQRFFRPSDHLWRNKS